MFLAPPSTRSLPVLSSSAMESSSGAPDSAPSNPPSQANASQNPPSNPNPNPNPNPNGEQAIGAAAAAQQPKVVQTAFIHKLYKYLHPSPAPDLAS